MKTTNNTELYAVYRKTANTKARSFEVLHKSTQKLCINQRTGFQLGSDNFLT